MRHSLCQAFLTEIFPLGRVFKTPGLRTPAARERVYNISANGSPLADSREIFLTVPVGGGEVSVSQGGQATVHSPLGMSFLGPAPTSHPRSPLGCMDPDVHISAGLRTSFIAQAGGPGWGPCPALCSVCSSADICPPALWRAPGVDDRIPALERPFSSRDRFIVKPGVTGHVQ